MESVDPTRFETHSVLQNSRNTCCYTLQYLGFITFSVMASSIKDLATNIVELEHFDGGNFIRWQKRVHFLLMAWKITYVLSTPKPTDADGGKLKKSETTKSGRMMMKNLQGTCTQRHMWQFIWRLSSDTTAKELWDKSRGKIHARGLFK